MSATGAAGLISCLPMDYERKVPVAPMNVKAQAGVHLFLHETCDTSFLYIENIIQKVNFCNPLSAKLIFA